MSQLTKLFDEIGMSYDVVKDGSGEMISTAFQVELPDKKTQDFSLFVLPIEDNFGDQIVRFEVVPYLEQPYFDSLSGIINQINHDLPLLKFAFDPDDDLELILDMPAEQMNKQTLMHAMQVLGDYSASYYPELLQYKSK